jgi:hypothetical protein
VSEYLKKRTQSGRECEVREVQAANGRRWHVKATRRDGPGSFYVWAEKHLPAGPDEERIWRGVLHGIDDELARDRSKMASDYDVPLLPQDFE